MSLVDMMRRKNMRSEPPMLQPVEAEVTPEVAAFIDSSKRMREDLAYYKAHSAQLENDVRLANERVRSLESELQFLRDERDALQRHDTSMRQGLRSIKVLITDVEEQARAEEYAPPGSGAKQPPEVITAQDEQILKGMTEKLNEPMPGEGHA